MPLNFDFHVEQYAVGSGQLPPEKRNKNSIYVATIEKASALLDSLIECSRFGELVLIVVDEFHMIGEFSRGAILESLLTKAMFLLGNGFSLISFVSITFY